MLDVVEFTCLELFTRGRILICISKSKEIGF